LEGNTQYSLKKPLKHGPGGNLGTGVVVFLSALYLFPIIHLLYRVGDEGTIVYGAQRVLEGQVPSRDFLELMGPGSFYWLALFFNLFGVTWQVTRFYLLFNGVATAFLIYWITRRFIRGAVSFVPSLFVVVLGLPFWPACSDHWDSDLFALVSIACFLKWQETDRKVWLIGAGALAGITSCFIQQKGLFLLLALTVAVFSAPALTRSRRYAFSAAGRLLTAYACVGAFVFLMFYRADALRDLLYANLVWPLSAYETVNSIAYANGMVGAALSPCTWLLSTLPVPLAFVIACLCLLPFLVIAALPLFLVGALVCSWKPAMRSLILRGHTITLWLTGTALWLSEIHRKDIFHLLYGAPVLVIALVVSTESLLAGYRLKRITLCAITAGLVLLGSFKLAECRSWHRIETRRGTVLDTTQDDALTFLNSDVTRREWVFIYPYYPLYNYLADVRNPTRFSILLYHYNTPEHFEEVIRELENKHVKYVLWDTVVDGANLRTWFPAYVQPNQDQLKLEHYLHLTYNLVSIKNGFRILRRNRY
jgi:hypothetical protein